MTRTVNADVVLAALHVIEDALSERGVTAAVRASSARYRVRVLIQQIENVAESEERGVDA